VVSGKVLSLTTFDDPFGHAENIGLAIQSALADAQVTMDRLTGIAIGRGPAPYTGLRVGMAAGLSIASALNVPAYGVMVLDAVAHSLGAGKFALSSDAKRREFFVAGYENTERVFGPSVMSPIELEQLDGFEILPGIADAAKVGLFAEYALDKGVDLSDTSALYLRSPDVSPSPGKKVSG
jgi:tRNA threonylcarbamoyl adenosine modification protein YeaZ